MKLMMTAAAAALISSTAVAGNSDRYNDLFLDTSKKADVSSDAARDRATASTRAIDRRVKTTKAERQADTEISTRRDVRSVGEHYAYGGYGPYNDSR